MDGRCLTLALMDERNKIEECGHGWLLFDSRAHG